MDAIAKGIGSASGAVEALRAGADCVLVSHSFDVAAECVECIEEAVRSGYLAHDRLRQAFERVAALRSTLAPPLPIETAAPHPGIGREIGRRAVTLLRGQAHADPRQSIVVSFESPTVEGVQGAHQHHALLPSPHDLPYVRPALDPQDSEVEAAVHALLATGKRPIVLMRRAHVYARQRAAVERLLQIFPEALIVSTREPFDALGLSSARHLLCTYGDDAPSMQGLADVIFGNADPAGIFPLSRILAAVEERA